MNLLLREVSFAGHFQKKAFSKIIIPNSRLFKTHMKASGIAESVNASKRFHIQNEERKKRANELDIANQELEFQNLEKQKRAIELSDAECVINSQNIERKESAVELLKAYNELKRAEQSIEFDRNNIKSLINNTTDLMWSVDTNYKFITSNQAFDEMAMKQTGRPVVKGGSVLHTGFNDDRLRKFISYYCRAFDGETFTETEFTSVPKKSWTEVSFHPIRNEGKVIGTACFSRDITQRKTKENYLKLLESVVTNTPDAVLILNAESRDGLKIAFVNKAFTTMTGYTSDEMLNKSPFRLAGPKSVLSKLRNFTQAIVNGKACEIEIVQYNKNGTYIWVNLEIATVLNSYGKVSHLIVIERDVTEKLKNLQALKDQNLVLKDIASMQSHEMRGPLASVMGLTNLLINHFDINNHKEILEHLTVCCNKLDDVITAIVRKAEKANSD